MARHLDGQISGDYARKYHLIVCCVVLLTSTVLARPAPKLDLEDGKTYESSNVGLESNLLGPSSWISLTLSLSFLIILASFLALCGAGGCCGKIQWFGTTRQDPPLSFSNPMTEPGSTMMVPISQIDVRALELDPIVFEPLPTVHDLTPHSGKFQSGQANHRNSKIPIVPFCADDSAVYAHDWFEEPHNNFPRSNIEYVKVTGKGWFGQVIEAEARDIVPFARKIRVIVKVLREDANGIEQMRFLDESRMYRDGTHGNVLKLMGHSIEKLPFLLIMEHCPQADLKSFLISNVIRAEMLNNQGTIVRMALDIAKGLEWLHSSGFIHPDLAARNCQVGSENRVVIGDYGLGTQNYKDDYHWSSNIAIPLRWTAPDTLHCTSSVIQILKVTESSNIWTYGVVVWEICEFGKLPYFELSDDEVISRVIIDKNYFLGRPTLPCMSAKEELYRIMSSCWESDVEHRPKISDIVRQLETLCKSFEFNTSPPRDEFDSKWEQLESKSSSDDERRRKKNVSFVGLENHFKSLDLTPCEDETETMRDAYCSGSTNAVSDLSQEIIADHSKDIFSDLDEEQWTKKIERGEITQKVLEKSQSVQDLMVLTHFEQDEMGELDSLVYIAKSPQSSVLDGKESESINSTLKKSSSETAIDSLSFISSSHILTPANIQSSNTFTLVPPDINIIPGTPGTTPNRTGIDINVISATPKVDDISVTHSSPNQAISSPPSVVDEDPTITPTQKLKFNFDTSQLQVINKQRHTSTPLRSGSTPSPRISDFDDKNEEENEDLPVFETSGNYMEGTFSVSPISLHHATTSSFNSPVLEQSHKSESSVLFGPSDDHELGSYQGVKSQLHEFTKDAENSDDEVVKTGLRPTLFYNGKGEGDVEKKSKFDTYNISASSNGNVKCEEASLEESLDLKPIEPNEPEDNDANEGYEFWEKQFKSIQVAAGNTRELFQIGLNDPEFLLDTNYTDDNRFVADIEAANEELGSLVLHDLDEPESTQIVIKETREAIVPEAGVSAILAFEKNNSTTISNEEQTQSSTIISEVDDKESLLWDITNSIEIRKNERKEPQLNETDSLEFEDIEEPVGQEFVPSKWNQNLVPSRPAIKSPEQQPKSGMKKSVSFEMKKTNLVYQYPPPPVASDSEEEEKIITPLAAAALSLPLSSSLDWELTQEELEDAEINHEDWGDEDVIPKPDPMDVYRISGFNDDHFHVRGSSEPFVFSPNTLGELRHTRDRLRLDLSRGEASFLDDEASKLNPAKLDSGVGSSTNVSPFNNCDILTKRSKNSD